MQNNSSIVRGCIEEVLNQGNIEAFGRFSWGNMVKQVPLPGHVPGLVGLKDVA